MASQIRPHRHNLRLCAQLHLISLQKDPRLATEGTSVNLIEEYNLLQSQLSLSLCLRRTSRACYWSLFLTMIFYYVSSYNFYPFSIINLTK